MKKITFLTAATLFLASFAGTASAQQIQAAFLRVMHATGGIEQTDDFRFEGGEITVKDNEVKVVLADASKNRSYEFDNVRQIVVEMRDVTAIEPVGDFRAFVEVDGNLRITSAGRIGLVEVYSIAGLRIASVHVEASETAINLQTAPRGVYIVKAGARTVKILK